MHTSRRISVETCNHVFYFKSSLHVWIRVWNKTSLSIWFVQFAFANFKIRTACWFHIIFGYGILDPVYNYDGPGLRFQDRNPEGSLNVSVQVHVHFIWKVYDSIPKKIHSIFTIHVVTCSNHDSLFQLSLKLPVMVWDHNIWYWVRSVVKILSL